MVTFLLCLALLVAAYFTYGRYLERLAGADARSETPLAGGSTTAWITYRCRAGGSS